MLITLFYTYLNVVDKLNFKNLSFKGNFKNQEHNGRWELHYDGHWKVFVFVWNPLNPKIYFRCCKVFSFLLSFCDLFLICTSELILSLKTSAHLISRWSWSIYERLFKEGQMHYEEKQNRLIVKHPLLYLHRT